MGGYSAIGGGRDNWSDSCASVGGGVGNFAGSPLATIGGGSGNITSNIGVTIGGGMGNVAGGYAGTVGGGRENGAGPYCFVGGGWQNGAGDSLATIGGGHINHTEGYGATIGGGIGNYASGGCNTVGGGEGNRAELGSHATVGGGSLNNVSGNFATVSGGHMNSASGVYATVAGGSFCMSAATHSFAVGFGSAVLDGYDNSAAFNGQGVTASGQTRVGVLSKASGTFTIDHPLDPMNKILNHYFVESPEMVLIYRGVATIGAGGRAEVQLPDYYDALNKNSQIQLTGVGTYEIFVAEEVQNNRFVIGGKPGTKVHWVVTGERKDPSAEITKIIMPVEQAKDGDLAGRSLDDDFLCSTREQLERMGRAADFKFRLASSQQRYEEMKRMITENR
jgi:hypothetical protein